MEKDDRIKWNVFQNPSIYLNDYRWPKYAPRSSSVFPCATKEPPEKPTKEYIPIDTETFVPWRKNARVPFDLYHTRKDIIGENPSTKIKMPEPIIDYDKEKAIQSRPRIYMKSAISLDDIPDPEMRKFVCDALYTTDGRRAEKEATGSFTLKPLPVISLVENVSFGIDAEILPNLPEGEWRTKGFEWDPRQTRSVTNANKMFWSTTKLPTRITIDLVPEGTKQEIKKLIENDMLRLPHDKPKPLYAGYKPNMSYGIPLRKKVEAITHPLLSTAQAITKRYEQ